MTMKLIALALALASSILARGCIPSAHAAPFLVCDPYPSTAPQPDSFSCVLDSGAAISIPATKNPDSSVQLHYDLKTLATGAHTAQCAAVSSLWGSSPQSGKLSFFAGIPAAPANLGLSAQ